MARLLEHYKEKVIPELLNEFKYDNVMQVPKLLKVSLNIGLGEAIHNIKLMDKASRELASITGQKPVVRKAKKAIAGFKLREGMPVGCSVTLRKKRMYEFVDRFFNVSVPRIKDFKGVSPKAFDRRGNYTLGIKEQIIFPEISYDNVDKVMGMNITFVTSATTDKEARALLKHLGMPFRN